MTNSKHIKEDHEHEACETEYPFHITKEEDRELRQKAAKAIPSPVISQASFFDEYVQQLMIPPVVMDMARKAENMRLSPWEIAAMRKHLSPFKHHHGKYGLLRKILHLKAKADPSHPPYIRVACTGKSQYDYLAEADGHTQKPPHKDKGDVGSPVVLEIWPAQHYSPIHSHGETTGIVFCLAGQLDVMLYDSLDWNAKKLGLTTLNPGQCAWLSKDTYPVHRVYCPLNGGESKTGPRFMNSTEEFGASFHVYLNEDETPMMPHDHEEHHDDNEKKISHTRNAFNYIKEEDKKKDKFKTHSDLSWSVLRRVLAETELS
ncbi:hypothetical protein [Halomonas caseinilytica]|uniref:hypothetical protein n=1 Tax=Halomonas caseinilytica TaxID=438744 RepID=UPI0007E58413|nr:hypothetical protein [Halomonas caseinilytica]SEM24705.1 hypothetical protein SAMN04487952_102249 [Halomonas caseinilytica]